MQMIEKKNGNVENFFACTKDELEKEFSKYYLMSIQIDSQTRDQEKPG